MIGPVGVRAARVALKAKGFCEAPDRDHEYYLLHIEGRKTNFWVKWSHGARDIRRDEIRINAKSIGIHGDDLYRVLNCEHDAAATVSFFENRHRG